MYKAPLLHTYVKMVDLRRNKYLRDLQAELAAFFIEHQNHFRTTDKIWSFTLEYLAGIFAKKKIDKIIHRTSENCRTIKKI